MKKVKKKYIVVLGAVVFLAVMVVVFLCVKAGSAGGTANLNEYEKALIGKWAYLHDKKTAVAVFQENGQAKFEGKRYSFSSDGERISFTDGSGEVMVLRYVQDRDNMNLYLKSKYVLENGDKPEDIVGVWICKEKNWTYEFTVKGTFMEDGILTGHYFLDEESGTVRLIYEDMLDDTVFYYRLTDEGLFIEYPWPMERIK